jgi:hypothetical protein
MIENNLEYCNKGSLVSRFYIALLYTMPKWYIDRIIRTQLNALLKERTLERIRRPLYGWDWYLFAKLESIIT